LNYLALQQKLNAAGASPQLVADGKWGPKSQAALVAFQRSHGLVPDGVAGPKTLAALGLAPAPAAPAPVAAAKPAAGAAAASVPPAAANQHTRAKAIVDGLGLTPNESKFTRMVAWHETNNGQGWPQGAGAGSFNMGAITTKTAGAPNFQHKDSRNDAGKLVEYVTWFKGYPSFQAGMKGLADFLLKPNVKAALARNDFAGAVRAQYENGYFTGVNRRDTPEGNEKNVADYIAATQRAWKTIAANTGETLPTLESGTGIVVETVVVAVVGGALWWWFKSKGGA
jgi:hypothetical protein